MRHQFPEVIDSTMRRDLAACEQKFRYASVNCLRPKGYDSIHLHFGGCLARGLEVFRKEYYQAIEGRSHAEAFDAALAAGTHALVKQWGEFEPVAPTVKTLPACLDALYSFFVEYPPDRDPVQPLWLDGKPAVEFTFALPIPGCLHPTTDNPILYAGRADMLATLGGNVWIDDEKSTGQLGGSWLKKWDLWAQFTGYSWAAREHGLAVRGTIVNGIGIYAKDIHFVRKLEERKQWEVDRWLAQLQRDVERAIHAFTNDVWNLNLADECSSYGGCAYVPLCKSQHPERWYSQYEERVWNPLERDIV